MTTKLPLLVLALSLAASVQAMSFGPIHHELLQILSFAAALSFIELRAKRSWLLFFYFHTLTLLIGLSWLHISMTRYGGMPQALSAAALVAFCMYLALFGTAAFAIYRQAILRHWVKPGLGAGFAFGGLWGLFELLRAGLFTGFPWLSVGYAHVDGVLSHWAAWVGVYGISALAIAASLWLAALLRSSAPYPPQSTEGADKRPSMLLSSEGKPGLIIALAILVITSSLLQHNWVNPSGPSFRSLLMQTNVSQLQKFDAQRLLEQHERIVHMILRAQVDLTVSPETAWISPWAHSPLESREKLVQALAKQGGVLALGMPLGKDIENGETLPIRSNSLVLMQGQGQWLGRYDKQHLVPFGEFVPPGFRWFVEQMRIPLGDFERGKDPAPIHTVAGRLIGFNICYEDLFPEAIAWQVQQGAHVLVNASNLAWFGDSHALHQHLQISRMRSLELQRPMLRATNTGATAAIGADGRVLAKLPHLSEEVLVTNVQPMKGLTPFARYRLGGTWVFLGLMLIVALCLARFKALTNRGIKISS